MAGRVKLYIDTTAFMLASRELSTKEVGAHFLALLDGEESDFSECVVRRREYASQRLPIPGWEAIRLRIFERDGWKCVYCGSTDSLECDHVVPVARGGGNNDENLATACSPCNRRKGAQLLDEWSR